MALTQIDFDEEEEMIIRKFAEKYKLANSDSSSFHFNNQKLNKSKTVRLMIRDLNHLINMPEQESNGYIK